MFAAALPSVVVAQEQVNDTTLNRTVVVEQEYAPEIERASKINVLPKVEIPTAVKRELEYAAEPVAAQSVPASTMAPYAGKEEAAKAVPGYLRVGYGNNGNMDAAAGYRFAFSPKDQLNFGLAFDGLNGELNVPDREPAAWDAHRYRTRAALDYTHMFRRWDLNAAAAFGLSNFSLIQGRQRFTSGDVRIGAASTDESLPLRFRAETSVLYYQRGHNAEVTAWNELLVRTQGAVFAPIDAFRQVGIGFCMNNLFYDAKPASAALDRGENADYTTVNLNPYYQHTAEKWEIHLGAHADFAFKQGKKIQVAPDVQAAYHPVSSITLYAQATGGRLLNDFRRLETLCPYADSDGAPTATYEQLNAAAGFKASLPVGFRLHLYGGYQVRKDELVSVYGRTTGGEPWEGLAFLQGDLNNLYAGVELDYTYRDTYSLHLSALGHKWKDKQEFLAHQLHYLPAWEGDVHADARPLTGLLLRLGYRHAAHASREGVGGAKPAPVSDLYLSGSYELFDGLGVYVRANNLLNKSYSLRGGCPAEGLTFLGGVTYRF